MDSSVFAMPSAGIFLSDLAGAVRHVPVPDFIAAVLAPALVELPPGTLGPHLAPISFDAPASERAAAWEQRLAVLRLRLRHGDAKVHFLSRGTRESGVIVGSSSRADIVLSAEDGVAPLHAQLLEHRGRWRLVDRDSSGTRLEGRRLPAGIPIPMTGGQRACFAAAQTVFLSPEQLHALAVEPPAASAIAPLAFLPPPAGGDLRGLAALVAPIARDEFVRVCSTWFLLQIPHEVCAELAHSSQTRTRALSPTVILGLGRDRCQRSPLVHTVASRRGDGAVAVGRGTERCDLVLPESSVSRRHAVLRLRSRRLTVVDLGSENGTWLDAARLQAGLVSPVRPGQTLTFGSYRALVLDPVGLHELARKLAGER